MDNFIIYTYGGQGELVAQIFNGIARIFGTNSEYFTVVGKFAMSLGAIWAATRAIFNTNIFKFYFFVYSKNECFNYRSSLESSIFCG